MVQIKLSIVMILISSLLASGPVSCAIEESEGNIYWNGNGDFRHEAQQHPHGEPRYGWRLVILPSPGNIAGILVKRIDEDLNLTCTAEYFDDGRGTRDVNVNDANANVTTIPSSSSPSDLKEDQLFKLTWHLPIMPQNSKTRVSFVDSHNSKQLIVEHLKESDAGEYECQAKAISDTDSLSTITPFIESLTIRVKPKKGSCNEPSVLCSSGECIAKRFLCDGFADCKDKSDEGYEICGTLEPCDGKLKCDDGRCIAPHWCCDRHVDKNCTTWVQLPCCRQIKQIQLSLETQFAPQPHHYNEIGFLQTTIYTVVGCSLAFMLIITIMVVAICRVHLKRTAMAHMSHPHHSIRSNAQNPFGDILFNSTGGLPYTSAASGLLVTYNINNGVQFMGRPVNPPPYSELARIPPREGPPPPYSSVENLAIDSSPTSSQNLNPNPNTTREDPPGPGPSSAINDNDVNGHYSGRRHRQGCHSSSTFVTPSSSRSHRDSSGTDLEQSAVTEPLLLHRSSNVNDEAQGQNQGVNLQSRDTNDDV